MDRASNRGTLVDDHRTNVDDFRPKVGIGSVDAVSQSNGGKRDTNHQK